MHMWNHYQWCTVTSIVAYLWVNVCSLSQGLAELCLHYWMWTVAPWISIIVVALILFFVYRNTYKQQLQTKVLSIWVFDFRHSLLQLCVVICAELCTVNVTLVGGCSCCERCCWVQHYWPVHHQALGNQICDSCGVHCPPCWPGTNVFMW